MNVEVVVRGSRADIILRRPEVLNALDLDTFDALASASESLRDRDDVRVVVVSGEGRSFCSGIDTSSFGAAASDPHELIRRAQAGFRSLATLPAPTIAAVHGHALGAGLQLALACDLRVVTSDASLGILELRYGLIPDLCGTQRLPALVGAGRAKKMIWTGERIDGAEAERIGLAEMVVASGELEEPVTRLATSLAAAPPLAVREVKRLTELSGQIGLLEGMDEEARSQMKMLTSDDFSEAITAFLERRTPSFRGR